MEGLNRLVSESMRRHGFDRPLDYRRLHWSRWFRCESHHSLLFVPSKSGVFAIAEEIMDLGTEVTTDASSVPPARSAANPLWDRASDPVRPSATGIDLAASTTAPGLRRMLAVTQFFEEDDMAFVLDRMLSSQNPMRARLVSGRYFVRFVVIEDQLQRRSICSALNQWMVSASEKATGIGSHFATSLELTSATEYIPPANDAQPTVFVGDESLARAPQSAGPSDTHAVRAPLFPNAGPKYQKLGPAKIDPATAHATAPQLDSGAASNIHCPSPFPSGF
jgi:hypothetical protein